MIGEAIGRAIEAVEEYGGTINNLMGDGFLALFGAPVAHEDDAERAVRAALGIMAAAREYADEVDRSWNESFAMRVGIHTGEVVVGPVGAGGRTEYGVMGDTINIAARLESAAGSDGILVSEVTQRQVANLEQMLRSLIDSSILVAEGSQWTLKKHGGPAGPASRSHHSRRLPHRERDRRFA